MRLIADLRDQEKRLRVAAECERRATISKDQFLQAYLALLALCDADQYRRIEPEFFKHLARDAHLPGTAVDQHKIRQHALTTRHGGITARQYLAHGRVVVAAG